MYAVPMVNGTPDFSQHPPFSQFYEIASNCSAATNTTWSTSSKCNGWQGAVVPANQTFPPVAANQPLAFVMFNMTGGVAPYTSNQYGSVTGNMRMQLTALLTFNWSPSAANDQSNPTGQTTDWWVNQFFGSQPPNGSRPPNAATHYSDVNNSATPDCSLMVSVIDPANPPKTPPGGAGSCFSLTNPVAGLQYANLTCAQISGRTFVYWFNDMGGGTDDKDYNDMYFSLTCVPPPASVNGGNLYSGTKPLNNITVSLVK